MPLPSEDLFGLYNMARQVTLYRGALLVERSYFPESARLEESHGGSGPKRTARCGI